MRKKIIKHLASWQLSLKGPTPILMFPTPMKASKLKNYKKLKNKYK